MSIGEKGIPLYETSKRIESKMENSFAKIRDKLALIEEFCSYNENDKNEIVGALQIEDILRNVCFSNIQHSSSVEYLEERTLMFAFLWRTVIYKIKLKIDVNNIDIKQLLELCEEIFV